MNISKIYYTTDEDSFADYLSRIKTDPETISVLSGSFFCFPDDDLNACIHQIHEGQKDFDHSLNQFSAFSRRQIIQSYLINEIQSTNSIENIHITRHDIFSVLKKAGNSSDRHIRSVVNSYTLLLNQNDKQLKNLSDLRKEYDLLMQDSFEEKDDKPDGTYFRAKPVIISDGMKAIHTGFYPEDKINEGMDQFLKMYNNWSTDIYLRLVLSHFMLETIHPFYDGNGRLGRYLFSRELYRQEKSAAAFLIASSINSQKNRYYKAFRSAEDIHEYGCLNPYAESLLKILTDGFNKETDDLKEKQRDLDHFRSAIPDDMKKSEKKILEVLMEASLFTFYGITTEEIAEQTSLSRRTIIYALNDLRERGSLIETGIGKFTYHKAVLPEKA